METSGKAGIPKWVPMKRIPWQFSQNSSLQLFGEPAIRPFILYNQIKGTRQTSIVIPKKSLSSRHCTIENSDKTTLPKWVLTEKIPWTIIIIVMLHLRSSLERWYLLCPNIFRHPKTKCLETGKWKNGFNGVPSRPAPKREKVLFLSRFLPPSEVTLKELLSNRHSTTEWYNIAPLPQWVLTKRLLE